jgi:hypothetical protein
LIPLVCQRKLKAELNSRRAADPDGAYVTLDFTQFVREVLRTNLGSQHSSQAARHFYTYRNTKMQFIIMDLCLAATANEMIKSGGKHSANKTIRAGKQILKERS